MEVTIRGPTLVERTETFEGVTDAHEGEQNEDHGVFVDDKFYDGWSLVRAEEESDE